jgi:hypothetical protein
LVTASRADPWFLVAHGGDEPLGINLRDVYPAASTAFAIKLTSWVEGELGTLLTVFREAARAALRRGE